VAVVAVRTKTLRVLEYDEQLEMLRMLVDRREELTKRRIQTVNRRQRLLAELTPGKSKKDITALQAKGILSSVRPRDLVGKTGKMLALEQLAEMAALDTKIKASTKELRVLVLERGSTLMDLTGVGPVVAARILADVGDVARFADRNRFASWTGTAPLDASSGEHVRHRLSRAGNRKANHVIHIATACQIRLDTPGRAYYRRKIAAGKRPLEAMRSLKRRISDAIYRQLIADAKTALGDATASSIKASPGGHRGASQESNAAGSNPHTGASDQPLPGPAPTTLRAATTDRKRPTMKPLQPAS
jgi:transposase